MSGPGSGAWVRFEQLVLALVQAGIEVHILGELGVHERAVKLGASSVELIRPLNSLQRLIFRGRRISRFAEKTAAQIVHLEAPPFVQSGQVPVIASLHDLRHFDSASSKKISGERVYQRFLLKYHAQKVCGWLARSYPVGK